MTPLFGGFGKSTGQHARGPVPVIPDPTERGVDRDFRLPDDPPHVIRVNQYPSPGLRRKLADFIPVAGITQPDALANALSFIRGERRAIVLERQPDNPVDPNAVAVFATWLSGGNEVSGRLGFLPAEVAATIAAAGARSPIGATLKVMYDAEPGRSPGIRLDIWVPARPRRKVMEKPPRDLLIPSDSVDRNLRGQELEREGFIDDAIRFYEANLADGFDGNFPYDRLAVIYRRRKALGDEIRVLERAVSVFQSLLLSSPRVDVAPKLAQFQTRLAKAQSLRSPVL